MCIQCVHYYQFRGDHPSVCCVEAVQELSRLTEKFQSGSYFMDPIKNLKIKDLKYIEMIDKKRWLESVLETYECIRCPHFEEHVRV